MTINATGGITVGITDNNNILHDWSSTGSSLGTVTLCGANGVAVVPNGTISI